ncbi:GH-E family nuclease [Ruminiclostridium cellulolyticum]|uniref:Toxin YqcG C-terminal domain-containing protein n=1 Tax=Ruminiclostridium cellulolyticum (strain ATCC 35319 / DSM 5812 / JCM 6584 / H10) TaxID=394503 RepID=B8I219_RUMCH|nr:GH-E family nuclease [Ruminiclostridium cellulolyticum]ACL75845.1 hypothetical protein Ccel_1492 [Ruminiclostridium cellulolyticum H10]
MSPVITAQKQKENTTGVKSNNIQGYAGSRKPVARKADVVEIIHRLKKDPDSLKRDDVVVLQSTIGNKALGKMLTDLKTKKEQKKDEQGKNKVGAVKSLNGTVAKVEKTKVPDIKVEEKPQKAAPEVSKKTEKQQTNNDNATVDKSIVQSQKKNKNNPVLAQSPQKTYIEKESQEVVSQKKKDKVKETSAPAKSESTTSNKITSGFGGTVKSQNEAPTKKAPAKAPVIKINSEDPGKILNSLGSVPPTEIVNAFSQASSVSETAFEKQKIKTQAKIPVIPTPTGLPSKKGPAKVVNKVKELAHSAISSFKSEKSGGKACEGMPENIKIREGDDVDADDIMQEAKEYTKNAPEIGMTGEADPNQMEGFMNEASQNAGNAKQAELNQTKQDFGENAIAPQEDPTTIKADKAIGGVLPFGVDINKQAPISPEVASRVNPQLNSQLKSFMQGKENEFQKGKTQFDSGISNAKVNADAQIENHKVEARRSQLKEQENTKSEVGGLREQWKNEISTATEEYEKDAGAETEKKKKEVGKIKDEKEGEVKKTLKDAEKDADKECKTAKKDADEEKKKQEEKPKSLAGKIWGGIKKVGKAIVDGISKAVSFIFDKLRQAVKTIFEKAKQLAVGIIEAGRRLIVSAIKGLGTVLKGLVKTLLAKFPGIANKICNLIDKAVNKAVAAVNKAAALLKKGVTAALNFMAKAVDGLFAGLQKLYKTVMAGIKKFLTMDFKKIFGAILEAAEIAAEIALAFATGGGSVLIQIVKWLATTLPQLLRTAGSVMNFVNTIKSIKLKDVLKLLSAAGIAGFLTKGLFGELTGLPKESKDEKDGKEPASGRAEKGLVKVLHALSSVFNVFKGVYNKIAGGVGKILGIINIAVKPWFATFSAIYAGAVKAMDVVGNPVETLSEGAGKLKEAVGSFFGNVKGKLQEIAGSIKSKVAILGQPAQLMKLIANKAVDMVLNFIISHPPSALIKAVFKGIEAIAGKSIVELVRQYIPFADKLFDKIAGSGPVQSLMKPLQGPINNVNGMIDEVTDGATGMVNNAEKSATSTLGSGAKLVTAMGIGKAGGSKANSKGDAKGESKGGGPKGGGDFLGILLSGIHTKLYAIGLRNIAKLGKNLASKVAGGAKAIIGKMLTPKVKFKLGNENHELWVEKGKNKNVVMMASTPDLFENKIKEGKVPDNGEIRDKETIVKKNPSEGTVKDLGKAVQKAKGVSKVAPMTWNEFEAANAGKYDKAEMSKAWEKYKGEYYPNDGKHYLERPYLRQDTINGITRGRGANGTFFDANTLLPIEGTPDIGHVYGREFWRERDKAEDKGWTQSQFNDYMNNSEFYQFEDPKSNRSHQFEDKSK